MNDYGTIGRPAPHGPRQKSGTPLPGMSADAVRLSEPAQPCQDQNRTRKLQLIPEIMARSHMRERIREAERRRLAHRLVTARRLQRKALRLQQRAERASHRARRALAQAVLL